MLLTPILLLALAQAEPQPAAAQARELSRKGLELYKQGKLHEAIDKFEAAYALKPHPGLHFNIAKCREELGEPGKALREYREYLREAPDATDSAAVQASVNALQRQLAQRGVQQLAVIASPPNAVIEVDGRTLGISPIYVELPAGSHTIVVTAADHEREERSVVLGLDKVETVQLSLKRRGEDLKPIPVQPQEPVALQPLPPPEPPPVVEATPAPAPAPSRRVWTWVTLGIGAGSAIGGLICGLTANGASRELLRTYHLEPEATALHSRASSYATAANVTWSIAAAALIAAVILFFVEAS